ncbi:hypothetical protein Hypma_003783 [Hypsizygus marmoreus]|uniref:Nephrocystin 3-like N-terminal domain-containing protein n=1 Tax=Hypsizygus marmoreus TaxID=39966 RepID=A0A369K6S4_HYPMA|nr:hypothetical protein Hypma_003783 [Hypsizygus marmoreus]
MAFSHSHNVRISRSSFIDVQGNMTVNQPAKGNIVIYQQEFGLQILMRAISVGAAFDSMERYPPPRCHPETRKDKISTIQEWVQSRSERNDGGILWLHGPAGAGKSAVAQTISESCAQHGQLAASFFFSKGMRTRDSIDSLFPTIAFQLAMSSPLWHERINKIVTDDPSVIHKTPAIQLDKLIIGLFSSERLESGQSPSGCPFLVVIDGLDECKGSRDQTMILNLISSLVHTHRLPLSFLIVSRPEPHITHAFAGETMKHICAKVSLYGTHQALQDVHTYLRSGFDKIHDSETHSAIMKSVPKPWPDDDILETLVNNSGGYFIYASTMLKYVDEEFFSPLKRLDDVLKITSSLGSSPFAELDKLYHCILSSNPNTELLKHVLGYLMHFPEQPGPPLYITRWVERRNKIDVFFETIFRLHPGEVLLSLRGLHSLVSIGTYTEVQEGVFLVHINAFEPFHASLGDYLFDESRAGKFFVDRDALLETICHACFDSFGNWEQTNTPPDVQSQIFKDFEHCFRRMCIKSDALLTIGKYADKSSWISLVCAANQWYGPENHSTSNIVTLVLWVLKELQGLDPQPWGLIHQFTSVLLAIFKHIPSEKF